MDVESTSQTELMQAVRKKTKKLITVRRILQQESVDPDARDSHGRTALSHAAEKGTAAMVRLLLEDDRVFVDNVDEYGRTPLSWAAGQGNDQAVEILLSRSHACLNLPDKLDLYTPLMWAIKSLARLTYPYPSDVVIFDTMTVAQLLACDDIDSNTKDRYGQTALTHAARRGYTAVVERLLQLSGIRADDVDGERRTPLSRAAERGHAGIVELLLKLDNVNPDSVDSTGRTPLSWAVASTNAPENNSRHSVVQLLLRQERVGSEKADNDGRTPLLWALHSKDLNTVQTRKVVELLLEQSSKVTSIDLYGRTPLSRAAEFGMMTLMQQFLARNGTYPDPKDRDGRTPLSQAAEHGQCVIVELLLGQKQVDPEARDTQGRTPVSWAAAAGQKVVVELLHKQKGVDLESVDNNGQTPLSRTVENGHKSFVKFLMPSDRSTLHVLAKGGYSVLCQNLLDKGYDVNLRDIHGRTSIHYAVSSGHIEVVQELIGRNADVNCEGPDAKSPLRLAIEQKRQDLVELLLENGAKIRGITSVEWQGLVPHTTAETVLVLLQEPSGRISVRFEREMRTQMLSKPGELRFASIYNDYSALSRCLTEDSESTLSSTRVLQPNCKIHTYTTHVTVFITGAVPRREYSNDQKKPTATSWIRHGIAWNMVPPSEHKDGSCWKSKYHFGTLPYGWIPTSGADFFVFFILKLREEWLTFTSVAEESLSDRRVDQLHSKGNGSELINSLAEDAKELAKLRSALKDHIRAMHSFVDKYCRSYDQDGGFDNMQEAISRLDTDVSDQLKQLDQTVKDLLQFEFAWVSINEAHRSTSIATSIKRLSWITFVFLPAMFVSSLFGMNVNILESNPDWRWYLLFGGGCLALTIFVWLLFKYGQIETMLESSLERASQRWRKGLWKPDQNMKQGRVTLPT